MKSLILLALLPLSAFAQFTNSDIQAIKQALNTNFNHISIYETEIIQVKAFPIYSEEFGACRQLVVSKSKLYREFTVCKTDNKWNIQ